MLIDIAANLIAAIIAAIFGYIYAFSRKKRHLKHLSHVATESQRVRIVLPAMIRAKFPLGHQAELAVIPENIPLMPMAEGKALAYVVKSIQDFSNNISIEYIAPKDFVDDGTPFVSLGGPSVNQVSFTILSQRAPLFEIKYPEHIAHYAHKKYDPIINFNILKEDFGFYLQTKSRIGTNCVVMCGVWATGTEMACLAFANSMPKGSRAKIYRKLRKHQDVFIALHAPVENYQLGTIELDLIDVDFVENQKVNQPLNADSLKTAC